MRKLEKRQRWDLIASVSLGVATLAVSHYFAAPYSFFRTGLALFAVICFLYGFSFIVSRNRTVPEMTGSALVAGLAWAVVETIRIHLPAGGFQSMMLCCLALPLLTAGGLSALTAILRHRRLSGKIIFAAILLTAFVAREPTHPMFPILLALFQIPFVWTRKLEQRHSRRLMALSVIFLAIYIRGIAMMDTPLLHPDQQWAFPVSGSYSAAAALIRSMAWVIIIRGLILPLKPRRIRTRLRWAFMFNFLVPFTLISFISGVTLLYLVGGYQIASAKRLLYRYGMQANDQAKRMWQDFTGTEPGREPPAPVPFHVAGAFLYKNGAILDFGRVPAVLREKIADKKTRDVEFFVDSSGDSRDWTLWIGGFHRGDDGSAAAVCYRIDPVMLDHIRDILGMDLALVRNLDLGLFPFQNSGDLSGPNVIRSSSRQSDLTYPIGSILISPADSPQMKDGNIVLNKLDTLATLKVLANRKTLAASLMRVENINPFAPLKDDTDSSGELSRTHSINVLNYLVLILLAVLGGLLAGLIILSVATSYLISRKINMSVRLLKIGMTRLDQGDLDHRIPVVTEDELGELAANFNSMTESLKRYQSERDSMIIARVEQERMKQEFETARLLQASLLPTVAPDLPGMEITGICRAANIVGGDYYDYIQLPGGELGLAIGDVSGHGMSAGILMSMAKSCIFNQIRVSHDVNDVITALNQMIFSSFNLKRMMTFLYAIFRKDGQQLTFASAGHHFPYLYRPGDDSLTELESIAYPLGVRESLTVQTRTVSLEPGDLLVFYTDGIVETQNAAGELLGFPRLESAIRRLARESVGDIMQGILAMVDAFRGELPEQDDATMVVIRITEMNSDDE